VFYAIVASESRHQTGTKHDRILDEAIISQDIAAERCSFSVLVGECAARVLAQDLVGKRPDGL
jgi:hypothetical protein